MGAILILLLPLLLVESAHVGFPPPLPATAFNTKSCQALNIKNKHLGMAPLKFQGEDL